MLLPIAFKWSLWTQPAGEHVHFAMQAAHVRQGTECHVFLELCCPARHCKYLLQCPFLPVIFYFCFGVAGEQQSAPCCKEAARCNYRESLEGHSAETETSEIKGTALFSCVAFCCPVILYVDYNGKIKFLIFPSLYLEQCKNSYTWSLWALLSHIHLLILCHCHLSDSGLLACMRS